MSEVTVFPILPTGGSGALSVENSPSTGGWQLIGTFGYADFTASGTYSAVMTAVLHRNAKARSFVIANSLNEALTSQTFWLFDSSLDTLANAGSGQSLSDANGTASQAYAQYTSEAAGILAFHGDSVMIQLTMGSTAPTSGDVKIYVNEFYN